MLSKTLTRLLLIIICLSIYLTVFSQNDEKRINSDAALIDSLNRAGQILNADHKKPQISLSKDQALKFLQQRTLAQYWKNTRDPFRQALNHLIVEASHPRFDSSEYFLNHYQYDSLNIPWDKFYIWEPMNVKIPVISKHELTAQVDSVSLSDTIMKPIIDSALINRIIADNTPEKNQLPQLKDTTVLVVIDTLNEVTSDVSEFPFRYMNYPYQGDSIEVAVKSLLNYLEERDSTIINFTGLGNTIIPVWMNSKEDAVIRYWLKNELSDSVTIWISNPEKNTIGLYLEQGVNFRRPVKQGNYSEAKINVKEIDKSKLHEIQKIYVKTQLWKYSAD